MVIYNYEILKKRDLGTQIMKKKLKVENFKYITEKVITNLLMQVSLVSPC